MDDLLKTLPYAAHAPFNTAKWQHEPTCLPDTRVDLQQQIHDWIDGSDERTIFWLNGLAGTGKSTIARTIAHNCFQQGRLGASFFFSKGDSDISHAGKFFTTIAAQLSEESQYLKRCIYDSIKENKSVGTQSYTNQWRQLILGPLSKLDRGYRPFSFIFVIDAMDECESDADISLILQLLVEAQSLKKVRLRVFLTSRPEIPIRHGMYDIPQAKHQDFVLQDIPLATINHDISLFLEHNLRIIARKWTLGADWPGEVVLRQLVQYACGLFIWAATACRFIHEGKRFARKRLDTILKGSSSAITAPEKHLNEIYLAVLKHSISSDYSEEEKEEACDILKHTLGSIVVLLSPLSAFSLRTLLNVPKEEINQTFEDLYAILDIPEDPTYPIHLHHPSFRDFLLNKDRCGEFWVDEKEAHQILATGCIRLMSQTLKKDICEMHAPGSQASHVESSWIEKCLPPEVQYACLYWVQHLQRSSTQAYDGEEAHQFLQAHLLHWLEALSWIGKTLEGIQALLALDGYVSASESPSLYAFIYDAKRFALYYRSVIEQTPLQLYCSALVFSAKKNIIRETFKGCIPDWIQLEPEVQAYSKETLQTLEGHTNSVTSVAVSRDGKQVVSGSDDETVRLWDMATGIPQQILKGHTSSVISVAFSPDGKQVVSGSGDKTVRLWDASWDTSTGAPQLTLKGHTSWVRSVAFSRDSKQVMSGSGDKTVRLWNAVTGAPLQILKGHTGCVRSVAFSPDSKQVVSGSDDETVRLWDAATGAPQQILKGHTSWVTSVAFSPDGKQVVSGSGDKTVRLWDASWDTSTGAPQLTLKGHTGWVTSVAFSPGGKQVVSGSGDKTVRLWEAATGVLQQTLKGHTSPVRSVAFSPDGKQVISGSSDKTVRLWDKAIEALQQMPKGYTSLVTSVAFSPDGKQVVSGSSDKTVWLWDAATGALQKTLRGHTGWVRSVAFSPNSKLVVSGSGDKTVRLWDVATGVPQQILKGHTSSVISVAFSPDGKQVVSRSGDKTVQLWNVATGALQQTLKGHTDGVSSVAFSPDGKLLPVLAVSNHWIVEGDTNILWLPPDYRETCFATWNGSLVIGHPSRRISFFHFKKGPKLIVQN